MAYRTEEQPQSIVIDGWENGIAPSPYTGISNTRNLNTSYYPGVAYTNYRRRAATLSGGSFFAGTHSVDVSNNLGWIFTAPSGVAMTNPVQKATSPAGINYILDDSGQIWKQTAVNSSTFALLEGGSGRYAMGNAGLAYFNNYLVVFGDEVIEFCGDGTDDTGIISTNWNISSGLGALDFEITASTAPSKLLISGTYNPLQIAVNDTVTFTTTNTLPAPLAINTTYYIKSIAVNGSSYDVQVAATLGGADIVFTTTGTGTHTIHDSVTPLPLGNVTSFSWSVAVPVDGETTGTINSYVSPTGDNVTTYWQEATGVYFVIFPDGTKAPATFTHGSTTITFLSPLVSILFGAGSYSVQLLDPTVTDYRPYVSKVDGNLYYCNGRYLGRILAQNNNTKFNPSATSSYTVNAQASAILNQSDIIVDMVDLKSNLVVASQNDVYTWDYVAANMSSPSPIGEPISRIANLLNNIYILAGQKGNIYISNGYSASLYYKIPDYISGVIDPVMSWGGLMAKRSKLWFQILMQNTSSTNLLGGIFSLNVTKDNELTMEAQNSYGLTPAAGALSNGILIDDVPSATGCDSYFSAWSNGATTGGIDYNDVTLWQDYEPTIETDIIPIGQILDKKTFGNIEFKLDRPMVSGDEIRIYFRPSLTDSYILMGTTTSTQLSDYYPSNISQSQWAQFKVQMKCASSSSSFVPLREIRLYFN